MVNGEGAHDHGDFGDDVGKASSVNLFRRYVMSNSKDCQMLHWSTKDLMFFVFFFSEP